MQHLFIYFVIIRCSTLESYNLYNSFLIFLLHSINKRTPTERFLFSWHFKIWLLLHPGHKPYSWLSEIEIENLLAKSRITNRKIYQTLILWYKKQKFFTFRELSVFWGELLGGAKLRYFIIWCNKIFHTSSQGFDKNLIYALCLCRNISFCQNWFYNDSEEVQIRFFIP